jgi:hypothetical protein
MTYAARLAARLVCEPTLSLNRKYRSLKKGRASAMCRESERGYLAPPVVFRKKRASRSEKQKGYKPKRVTF